MPTRPNFQVVVLQTSGGAERVVRYWRNNNDTTYPWIGPDVLTGGGDGYSGAALVNGTWPFAQYPKPPTYPRNLRVFPISKRNQGEINEIENRDPRDLGGYYWQGSALTNSIPVRGPFGFIQGTYGEQVCFNYELVVPTPDHNLAHYWFDHMTTLPRWNGPDAHFGSGSTAAALIQSDYGNLEVVAIQGNQLVHIWRESNDWRQDVTFGSNVAPNGSLGFIQSTGSPGSHGNFEVVVAQADGKLAHYYRDNTNQAGWIGPTTFGDGISAAAVIQYSQGAPGNLQVVGVKGTQLVHFERTQSGWSQGTLFGDNVTGSSVSFVEGDAAGN